MTEKGEGGKGKSWGGEALHKLCLLPSRLLKKKSILSTTFGGKRGWKEMGSFYEVSRSYPTMGQIQEEADSAVFHKKKTEYDKNATDEAETGRGTDNHSSQW